jgi:hypothetical protein
MSLIQPKTMPMLKGKDVQGYTSAIILASKYGGIQRPAKAEPWEAEKILMVSMYGVDNQGVSPLADPNFWISTLADCEKLEPGSVKYYIVMLPWRDSYKRPEGRTPIACAHLASAPSFDALEDALEAYGDYA